MFLFSFDMVFDLRWLASTILRVIVWGAVSTASRALPEVFTVTTTGDSGDGSLRQAILMANASPGANIINFNIVGGGLQTIAPLSALPAITNRVAINGYSQPGSSANTLADGDDAVLLIRLDGVKITNDLPAALSFSDNAGGSSVRGLVIVRFSNAIHAAEVSDLTIAGNYIGMDVDGVARGTTFEAIYITSFFSAANNIVIGGTLPADRNVISGNRYGIFFSGTPTANCFVQGNFIGTDPTGTLPRGNLFGGVYLFAATNITIGGPATGARNVISGATAAGGTGVSAQGGGGHLIQNNYIGTDVTGQYDLGNFSDGVYLTSSRNNRVIGNQVVNNRRSGINLSAASCNVIENNLVGTDFSGTRPLGNALAGVSISGGTNRVGGLVAGQPNLIQFNGGAGVEVTTATALQNEISGNRIYDNGGLGIDLGQPSGVTTNDPGDVDTGANELQNYPVLTSASSSFGATQVQGTLNSGALTTYRLEFFASSSFDPTGIAEGEVFLGSTNVTTDGNGDASFIATFPVATPTNYLVTATATDASGNTSELSEAVAAAAGSQNLSLSIMPAGGSSVDITWPGGASLYQLEATDSINPTSLWHAVTSGIVDLGQWKSFIVTNIRGSNQFFRLHKL